jgi:hypothetical protein
MLRRNRLQAVVDEVSRNKRRTAEKEMKSAVEAGSQVFKHHADKLQKFRGKVSRSGWPNMK